MAHYYASNIADFLIGKQIKKGERINDNLYTFHLNEGPATLFVEGDCCSHSWIESIEGEEALIDATIYAVDQVYGKGEWASGEEDTGDYRQTYFLKIRTDKGYWDMEFRNDLNGYYGAILSITEGERHE